MKKGILVYLPSDSSWIGGIYYVKNMAFQLSRSRAICNQYNIYVLTGSGYEDAYRTLPENVKIIVQNENGGVFEKARLLFALLRANIAYVFPYENKLLAKFTKTIKWIPDFQHKHLPELFASEELKGRDEDIEKILKEQGALVLSSRDCLRDLEQFYNPGGKEIHVIPFVSYIEQEVRSVDGTMEQKILEKFGLAGRRYVCIANQFWKHKNHIVVLKAIEKFFQEHSDSEAVFVFTGNLEDRRNPEYIELLKEDFHNEQLENRIRNLGFLDRTEQIIVMKKAEFIIQPSLFEGWGTVVEDCKVLDKTILLSDIPVHREQRNDKCVLFDPHNEDMLATIIHEELCKTHSSDVAKGIADMYRRAQEYVKEFEKIVCR